MTSGTDRDSNDSTDPRRDIPSMTEIINDTRFAELCRAHPRPIVLEAVRYALEKMRANMTPRESCPENMDVFVNAASILEDMRRDRLRRVVNATGIVLHTGLGRAVLPTRAVQALAEMDRCSNLQIDLETGRRGKRNHTTEELVCMITGAEAAMVVNNNAAATYLILTALCSGREVIVSRGQLIEIGGSFRLPDCMRHSGAILVETGTTNKTHLRDYEAAITENTAAIMYVNPSNYRITGFTGDVPIPELACLASRVGTILIDDLGCGALVDLSRYGLPSEPTAQDGIRGGADLVCFSGDKLIGGPQSGIIAGKRKLIDRISKHPMTRMLRVCKLTDIALQQTLELFLDTDNLPSTNPTYNMLTRTQEELRARAERIVTALRDLPEHALVQAAESASAVGGGSLPGIAIPTHVVTVSSSMAGAEEIARLLRRNEPPVITRVKDNRVLLDTRTLMEDEDEIIISALRTVLQ